MLRDGRGTKALFSLGALSRVPCSGTKMDVVQTRQCPELIMFIDNQGNVLNIEKSTTFILVPVPGHGARVLDRGQTSKICEKQGKYSKGKVVTSTVQSSIPYQYPGDLLTFLELY